MEGSRSQNLELYPKECAMGRELGVVRVSLGLASDFRDVFRVVRFAETIASTATRDALWAQWLESKTGEAL